MRLNFRYLQDFFKKNQELSFVIVACYYISYINSTFSGIKNQSTKEYLKIINNLYFQKTFKNVLEGFEPKYLKVEHKIENNDSINNILKNYGVPKNEINNILNSLLENKVTNNIKVNDIVNLTIDNSNMTVSKLGITISKTKKIELIRDYEKDIFKKKEIVTNLQKKIFLKKEELLKAYIEVRQNKIYQQILLLSLLEYMDFKLIFKET